MFKLSKTEEFNDSTFLPEDYVERKAERRTNMISISLFIVVTMGVIGAFFVTNREWNDVKHYQQAINVRYTQAAKDIEQLKILEQQKTDLLAKAELTTALIEKVPRSILLAELINRMPKNRIVLLEFEIQSKRLDRPSVKRASTSRKPKKGKSLVDKVKDEEDTVQVRAPRFETEVTIIGVAPRHRDVAHYVASLQDCPLLSGVELVFSEATTIKERAMNKFKITASLRADKDARSIDPLQAPRLDTIADMEAPDPSLLEPATPAVTDAAPEKE